MFGSTIIEIGGRIVQNAGAFQLLTPHGAQFELGGRSIQRMEKLKKHAVGPQVASECF